MDTDADLIRRTLDGDPDAFGRLVDRYKDAVYGAAYARVGDFHDAQDIVQETFVHAYRRLAALRSPDRFASWLYAIALNVSRDHLRLRRQTLPLDEDTPAGPPDSGDEHDRRALHRRIQQALASLSEVHRETVTLYYINGYTCDEVGGFLGVPSGTVKRRLFDARRQLRKEMFDMVHDIFDAHKLPPNFRKVVIDGIHPDPRSNTPRLHVRDRQRRGFPIEIGDFQGTWIYQRLHRQSPPRPITYDLFLKTCSAFGIALDGIGITEHEDGYRADATFSRGRRSVTLEADPGDAVALALWFDAPVYVDESLLKGMAFQRPKASKKSDKQPPAVRVDEGGPWALIDRAGGRIEKVQIFVSVQPAHVEKPPTDRRRAHRLADQQSLLSIRPVGVGPELHSERPLIYLADEGDNAYLPIAVGIYEARAVASALPEAVSKLPGDKVGKIARDRGWAYDLLKAVLDAFEITHERVIIDLLQGTTFYALNFFRRGKTVKRLDARPSDSIALSVRTGAQTDAHQEVMMWAGTGKDRYQEWQQTKLFSLSERREKKMKERRVESPYHLTVGSRVRFVVKSRRRLRWESSDPSIASVAQEGLVKGIKAGRVKITAT